MQFNTWWKDHKKRYTFTTTRNNHSYYQELSAVSNIPQSKNQMQCLFLVQWLDVDDVELWVRSNKRIIQLHTGSYQSLKLNEKEHLVTKISGSASFLIVSGNFRCAYSGLLESCDAIVALLDARQLREENYELLSETELQPTCTYSSEWAKLGLINRNKG